VKYFHRGWTRKPHEHKPISYNGKVRIARLGDEYFVQKAETYVNALEWERGEDLPARLQLKRVIVRWRAIPGEQQQLATVLQRFLRRTLVILALAISGLVLADALYAWVLTRWLTRLLVFLAAYRLWRDTYAVVREAARSIHTLMILALLLLLTTPAWAGTTRCITYEEKTLGRLQTMCADGTRAVSTWSPT
jgi:cation transport ATPase